MLSLKDKFQLHESGHFLRIAKMCHENMHFEFELGSGRIVFGRVILLGVRIIPIMCHKITQVKFRYGSI